MSEMCERLARLEERTERMEQIEKRLRAVEQRIAWGMGGLAMLQVVATIYLKLSGH